MAKPTLDLGSFVIAKAIVHDIPKHKKGEVDTQPRYSENISTLNDGLKSFFIKKISSALKGEKTFQVCFNKHATTTVPQLITGIISDAKNDFVGTSKEITKQLFSIQDGKNAGGVLVIILGEIDKNPVSVVLKLERDEGVQLDMDETTKTINIKEVHDLMLTEKTRIFKVALFCQKTIFKLKYDGLLTDYQIELRNKTGTDSFFMDKFLGCYAFGSPKIATKNFFNTTTEYIKTIEDPVRQTEYLQHLNSYMQMNKDSFSPKEFCESYLKSSNEKDSYREYIKARKIDFDKSYIKDTDQINNKIKRIVVLFENDIQIVGKKGSFGKEVKITKIKGEDKHKAEIISKIKKIYN